MRVAVVHYHYRPGGVTRVVENAFASLQGRGITAVAISGEPYQGNRLPVRMQPGLRYSQPNEKLSPGPMWYSLKMAARQALGGEPDLWHFHNPALGKNSAMAEVVEKMAADAPVLLQFHDFAEDGRPANYRMLTERMENIGRLYPQAAQVHYATLNERDRNFLRGSGFRSENIHLLPNPVEVPGHHGDSQSGATLHGGSTHGGGLHGGGAYGDGLHGAGSRGGSADGAGSRGGSADGAGSHGGSAHGGGLHGGSAYGGGSHGGVGATASAGGTGAAGGGFSGTGVGAGASGTARQFGFIGDSQALYLYPTRAIRRKNLGEFLLWAALSPQGHDALYASTLEPENPTARPIYERWVAFAKKLRLPVAFGVGQGAGAPSFADLMARADAVVSTSVAEGFGLAFLEPYLFGKAVVGRNLPEITADFAGRGIDLGGLYERLLVPEDLFSMPQLRQKVLSGLERTYRAYGRTLPDGAADAALAAMGDGDGRVDFGRLDEDLQEQVIATLVTSPQLRGQILPASLVTEENAVAQQGRITRNMLAVERHYSLERYGQELASLYTRVAGSQKERLQYAAPALLLDKFLAPERFSLLCS